MQSRNNLDHLLYGGSLLGFVKKIWLAVNNVYNIWKVKIFKEMMGFHKNEVTFHKESKKKIAKIACILDMYMLQ